MLTTDQKGSIAEMAIAYEDARLGICVLKPMYSGVGYDLVFDLGRLLRVQCKWAVQRREVVEIPCRTCRRGPEGFIRSCYGADEIDLIAGYYADLSRSYLLPIGEFAGRTMVALRLSPSRNNQRKRVNWAKNYEFAATLNRLVGP
jgi:hypothetical protein